ncbi:hypothetical protein EF514_03865 [Anaerosphaera multitolerans]|uniref:Uncharacterized protein n=1 Tax=Anaerosphaera multitolerans TaxID=2487351 RepID=A0A437S7J7_9FIRM|nr:hypothetical protein EF514_03865 [Anaerosphaera multitolerans]
MNFSASKFKLLIALILINIFIYYEAIRGGKTSSFLIGIVLSIILILLKKKGFLKINDENYEKKY